MRKSIMFMVFLTFLGIVYAQEDELVIAKGDIVILGESSGSRYQHIDFPKKNTIIKRGAIADFNNLFNEKLLIEHIDIDKNGNTEVVLKRKNGLRFFRFYPTVKANLEKALANGELKMGKKKKLDSIAK